MREGERVGGWEGKQERKKEKNLVMQAVVFLLFSPFIFTWKYSIIWVIMWFETYGLWYTINNGLLLGILMDKMLFSFAMQILQCWLFALILHMLQQFIDKVDVGWVHSWPIFWAWVVAGWSAHEIPLIITTEHCLNYLIQCHLQGVESLPCSQDLWSCFPCTHNTRASSIVCLFHFQ